MATNLNINDTVYLPCSRLAELSQTGIALYKTVVLDIEGRSAKVSLPGGLVSEPIATSLLHRDVGIYIINIGDFDTEHTLLDPLAKSVGQFCRLLVPDDQLRQIRVRSLSELKQVWHREQNAYSHVIWIGHGSEDGIKFAVDGWVPASTIAKELRVHGAPKKLYISLCCKTGYKTYGGVMSRATICSNFIGPFHSVAGAVASQFCQTFLTSHFLDGRTVKIAFKHAREAVTGSASFRLWNSGKLKAGPKS